MKRYAPPLPKAAFAARAETSPWTATPAADGTKLNLKMAIVANAAGMKPIRTGMSGLETSLEALLSDFQRTKLLDGPPIVEYTLGIPSGVFVIARSDDCHLQGVRSEEHTSELQSQSNLVCRLLLEKKKKRTH